MSSYFLLGCAFIALICGLVLRLDVLHVMSVVFLVGSVIVARCDTIIKLLRSRHD